MASITLREVTRDNWQAALELAVYPDQLRFVAAYEPIAAIALAKAYIRPGWLVWTPYLFYSETEPIGFAELAYKPGSVDNYGIYHFFIDKRFQGHGYGRKALDLFILFVKDHHISCQFIHLTVHPENQQAQHLYTSAGFRLTSAYLHGEPVYRLMVRPPV